MPEYEIELNLLPNQNLTIEDCLRKAGVPEGALGFFDSIVLEGLTLQVYPTDQSCHMELRLGTEKQQQNDGCCP